MIHGGLNYISVLVIYHLISHHADLAAELPPLKTHCPDPLAFLPSCTSQHLVPLLSFLLSSSWSLPGEPLLPVLVSHPNLSFFCLLSLSVSSSILPLYSSSFRPSTSPSMPRVCQWAHTHQDCPTLAWHLAEGPVCWPCPELWGPSWLPRMREHT